MGSADNADRGAGEVAGLQCGVSRGIEGLISDLPSGFVTTAVAGVDDLPAVVLVVLVAAGHNDRLGTCGTGADDSCLDRAVHTSVRYFPAGAECHADLDAGDLTDGQVVRRARLGRGVADVEPECS